MGFPSEHTAVSHLHNTLLDCTNLSSFNIHYWKKPFTLSLDATKDHIWSFCFSVSQTVDYPMFYKAINTLQLSPF